MVAYLTLVREITGRLKGFSVTQIPREENIQADRLACLASSSESDLQGTRVKYLPEPSVSNLGGMDVDSVDIGPCWMVPMVMYLSTRDLPIEKTTARRVRYWAARYHLINEVLYKRGFTTPYLQCIYPT